MSELKPCPFCGTQPVLLCGFDGPRVSCENKKCVIAPATDNFSDDAEAIAAWNTRPDASAIRREALEEAAKVAEKGCVVFGGGKITAPTDLAVITDCAGRVIAASIRALQELKP